jgi:hypothetical protein
MAEEALVQSDAAQGSGIVVHSIPMEFYGGKNPAPTEIPVTPAQPVQQRAPQAPIGVVPRPAATSMKPPAALPKKRKTVLFVAIGAVVLCSAGFAVWWFVLRTQPQVAQDVVPPPPVVAIVPEPPVIEIVATTTPEVVVVPEVIKPPAEVLIPNHQFKNSVDEDSDGLTDIEEELWGTNGAAADSDSDTFADTTEITNLYNPAGVTPERLIEAQLVSTYINPEYQYSMYYPKTWIAQSVDEGKKEVLFTSITQEFVSVRVLPFPTDVPFAEWFAKTFPAEQLSSYLPFVNKFKISGVMSADGMVAIITDGAHVYLLTYNGGTRDEINYRTTFKMMVQSFKTSSVTTPIELLPKTTLQSVQTVAPLVENKFATSTSATTSTKNDLLPDEVVFITNMNATSTAATTTKP